MKILIKYKKSKLNDLCSQALAFDISFNKPITKDQILKLITTYIKENYLEPIIQERTDDYNLIELGINLKNKLDKEYSNLI